MKKTAFYLLLVVLALPVTTQAKVWRVNNNPGVVADFNNLAAAMNAYAAGDTIHLEPSATAYTVENDFFATTNKFVTIIGNGYLHFEVAPLQQDRRESMIESFESPIHSSQFINAHIKFIGIVFNENIVLRKGTGPVYVNDVYFESCLFKHGLNYFDNDPGSPNQINGLHFSKNYSYGDIQIDMPVNSSNSISNFSFENNIIIGSFTINPMPIHDQLIVRNNVFGLYDGSSFGDYICNGAYWANNIFTSPNPPVTSGFTGATLKNNVFACPVFTTGAGVEANNHFGVTGIFSNHPEYMDGVYEPQAAEAIGTGVPNGATPVDCGAYGGPDPYKRCGMPAIPSVYELLVPSTLTTGTDMHITLKSTSNN